MADELPATRPCVVCGIETTGSVGAAGLRWPMICQHCKDEEDARAEAGCLAIRDATDFAFDRLADAVQYYPALAPLASALAGVCPGCGSPTTNGGLFHFDCPKGNHDH